MEHCILHNHAGVAELADALDSKSSAREGVPVRPRPPVSHKKQAQKDDCISLGLFFLHVQIAVVGFAHIGKEYPVIPKRHFNYG